MLDNTTILNELNSPIRNIEVEIEAQFGASFLTLTKNDYLQSFTVERVGESGKFFGFGIIHKLTLVLLDKNKEINIDKNKVNEFYISYKTGNEVVYPYPLFYLTEFTRDENTNTLTITAYDVLYEATQHTYAEVKLNNSIYTLSGFTDACLSTIYLSTSLQQINIPFDVFHSSGYYSEFLLNYDGTETIREVLDDIAEYTQSIYYIDINGNVVFKRLNKDAEPLFTIDKSKYFTLETKDIKTLREIVKATSLGDNIAIDTGTANGETQYIKDNGLYELLEADRVVTLLNEAITAVGGLSITPFECEWRGNYLLEIGDKIGITAKDDTILTTYLLDDVTTYNGGLSSKTRWAYEESKANETVNNPATLGELLKQTYAKVDKINNEIEIVADETAMLKINSELISNSVTNIEKQMNDTSGAIEDLTQKVEATMTAEQVNIAIQNQLANGVTSVTTTTGFTFNADGLTVSKSDSDISTTITEDGMTINKKDKTLLTANNVGVNATNLHATTYLIVGTYSRFEDYEQNGKRTGCFWIAN